MSSLTKPLFCSGSSKNIEQDACNQAVDEVCNILLNKKSTKSELFVSDGTEDIDITEVTPLLHEIAECIENYKSFFPSSREAKTVCKFKKSILRDWQPYTSFGYSILKAYQSLYDSKLAWLTFRLNDKSSRLLYGSKSPSRAIHKLIQYHLKKSISGQAKGMLVIERSPNRPLYNIVTHNGEIIKEDYQLHVHMLIVGTEYELDKLCGKHKGYKGLKHICSNENNAILCEYTYSKKTYTTAGGKTTGAKKRVPVDRGAADYMAKEFDKPIVEGARNFSLIGIESDVIERWNKTFWLQKRLIKICTDVVYQLRLDVKPEFALYQTIRKLLK